MESYSSAIFSIFHVKQEQPKSTKNGAYLSFCPRVPSHHYSSIVKRVPQTNPLLQTNPLPGHDEQGLGEKGSARAGTGAAGFCFNYG